MKEFGVGDGAVLLLRKKINVTGMLVHAYHLLAIIHNNLYFTCSSGSREIEQDAEMMRLQVLGNPDLMRELEHVRPSNHSIPPGNAAHTTPATQTQPDLANAARSDPARFSQLLRQFRQMQADTELERQREMDRLEADPYNIEAQRKIEETIRQQAVLENMQTALEHSPEAFGRVIML